MKDLLQKTKLFYKRITIRKETYKRRRIRPLQDWAVILVTNFFILGFLIIFSIYFYLKIREDKLFRLDESGVQSEEKIDINLLEKTVLDIKAREELTNDLKTKGVIYPDPSL